MNSTVILIGTCYGHGNLELDGSTETVTAFSDADAIRLANERWEASPVENELYAVSDGDRSDFYRIDSHGSPYKVHR